MQFNNTSSPYDGIIQNIERESKLGLGTISDNSAPDYFLAYFLGKINEWLLITEKWIQEVNDEATFDDTNNTGTIPESFSFTDNTQKYTLDTDILRIRRIQVHDIVSASKTFTVTISTALFALTNHGLVAGDIVQFTTTGALPTGISTGTDYYVISSGLTADVFKVSVTLGGSSVSLSGTQSGTHTIIIDKIGWYDLDYNYEKDREEDLYGQDSGLPSKYFLKGRQLILDVPVDTAKSDKYRIDYDRRAHKFVIGDTTAEPGFEETYHWILVYGATMDWANDKNPAIYNKCFGKVYGAGEGDPKALKTMLQDHYMKQNQNMRYKIGRENKSYD